jgi:hypothetical protein
MKIIRLKGGLERGAWTSETKLAILLKFLYPEDEWLLRNLFVALKR